MRIYCRCEADRLNMSFPEYVKHINMIEDHKDRLKNMEEYKESIEYMYERKRKEALIKRYRQIEYADK